MKRLIVAAAALAAAFAATTALADTLTWTGAANRNFSDSGNWTNDSGGTRTTPLAGDTVKFNSSVTLTETSEFNLGSATDTLTFDLAGGVTVVVSNKFTGAGSVTKTGSGGGGTLTLMAPQSTHTGGFTILNGVLSAESCKDRADPLNTLGTGPVNIVRASGLTPCLKLGINGSVVTNAINITGPFNAAGMDWQPLKAEICFGNNPKYSGPITSEGSFRIANNWAWDSTYRYSSPVLGPVTVTGGGTLYAHNAAWFANTQDCSVVVFRMTVANNHKSLGGIYFGKGYANENADAVITNAVAGHLQFNEGSSFKGREVVASGAAVTNVLNGAACFGDDTVVRLLDGALLQVSASVARVPRLFVGETELPAGVYTAANFPGTFLGSGTLLVGKSTQVSTWKGGALGSWTEAKNWDTGIVPCDGQIAVFNSAATINEGEVTIGEGGLTVICNADVTVATNATFTGVGKLAKAGANTLTLQNYIPQNSYAGGTDIFAGTLLVAGDNYKDDNNKDVLRPNTLGTGRVTIYRSASANGSLSLGKWMALTNEVSVVGPYPSNNEPTIRLGNTGGTKGGRITATADFALGNSYAWKGAKSEVGDISAHGHVVRYPGSASYNYAVAFVGTVDASLEIDSTHAGDVQGMVHTEGRFVDPDATYSVLGGSNVVTSAGSILCTNVVVGGSTKANAAAATLVLQKGARLSEKAKVTIQGLGRLAVASGSKVKVAELWAPDSSGNLVKQPVGVYSANGVPAGATITAASFTDTGRLRVGEYGAMLIVR